MPIQKIFLPKMKFSIIINKSANFYFFIQNLSEWHFSNRKDYNVLWRNELGQFSPREEDALKQFKEIHLRYPFEKLYIGRYFFLEENIWPVLEQKLSKEDFIAIKNIFFLLQNKFNLLWNKELPLLLQWQKELNDKVNNPLLTESIVNSLEVAFNTPPSESEVKINLLPSSVEHTGGGANIDNKNISLEISRYPVEGVNHAIGIIWHETIHRCFQKQYFFPLVLKKFSNNRQKADLVNEVTVGALFPRGILGIRLLKNKPPYTLINQINSKQTVQILDLMKEYVDNKKYLDEKYIESIVEILRI